MNFIVDYEIVKCALMYMLRRIYSEQEASNERIFELVENGSVPAIVKWLEDLTGKPVKKC